MDLALFSLQKFELFLLILVRTAGIFTLTPVLGASQAPPQIRIAIALGLTLVLIPVVPVSAELPVEIWTLLVMMVREMIVGLAIGFICSMVFATVQVAGRMVDMQSGLGFASMVDPVTGSTGAITGRFQNVVITLLFLATNAHHLVIQGLADSFVLAPVGELSINPMVAGGFIDLFASLFMIAVRIAMPIVAAVFVSDVALGMISRAVPQMNVLIVGFPLKLGVAMAALVVSLPLLVGMSQGMFSDMYYQMGVLTRGLTAP